MAFAEREREGGLRERRREGKREAEKHGCERETLLYVPHPGTKPKS